MLSVDYRQLQYRTEKLEADLRQESEKGRNLLSQLERLREEKSLMQSDMSVQVSEITLLRTNEKRLLREAAEYRERAKSLEEELHKARAARSVDDMQKKELEEQLEAEQYFSTLYKTQVRELQGELDEGKEQLAELQREREALSYQLQQVHLRCDSEARERRVAEEDIGELEKEKMMIELELKDVSAKFKSEARNLEMQLVSMKDTESDLLQRIDLLSKDNNELQYKVKELQDELNSTPIAPPPAPVQIPVQDMEAELEKLKKMLSNEKLLKMQAVNKLAEIMNRKDFNKKDRRAENKVTSAELRKKEKDNRRLQQELTMEKEKFNQMVVKYSKDLQDLQASLYEESQVRIKLSMELDTKESDLETLQNKLAHMNLDTASLSSGAGDFGDTLGPDDNSLEGWLQVPSRQNIRRHGWKKLYVIVSSKKIIFFNSEVERQNADPMLIIDLK
jgi:Rho-associated protein kinase 2